MAEPRPRSWLHLLIFWWLILILLQFGERLFLLPGIVEADLPSAATLAKIFAMGWMGDAVTATGLIGIAAVVTAPLAGIVAAREGARRHAWSRTFPIIAATIAVLLGILLIIDVGYFTYSHQHLDFVFFEYLHELIQGSVDSGTSQAAQQTGAELAEAGKWTVRIGGFLLIETLLVAGWWWSARRLQPTVDRWHVRRPLAAPVLMAALVGVVGLSPAHVAASGRPSFASEGYHTLAQNPILFAREPLLDVFVSRWKWTPRRDAASLTLEEAVRTTQSAVGGRFPAPEFPLVREQSPSSRRSFSKPVNVLMLFVEGLDRRYVGRTVNVPDEKSGIPGATRAVPLTPFLDDLQRDSVYFANFLSNGVQTARGLFSALCSAYPRHGTAAIKTRADRNYLCLPAVLERRGYDTELVVGLESDLAGLRTFAARNGIQRVYGDSDFGHAAERLGVGITDRDLLHFLTARLETLQHGARPFWLAAMTAGMHHPFVVPRDHPDVEALTQDHDGYPAALRSFDLALERFFAECRSRGLLKETIVVIVGDHGRHEPVGRTDLDRQLGHFLSPLFIWVDESVRREIGYRPRRVFGVTSQVDIAPTILSLNGFTPALAPFVGRDVSCALAEDCAEDNHAYLSSVYDDLIGWADSSGVWLYSFRRHALSRLMVNDDGVTQRWPASDAEVAQYRRLMFAVYLTSNVLLEEDRLWPVAPAPRRS